MTPDRVVEPLVVFQDLGFSWLSPDLSLPLAPQREIVLGDGVHGVVQLVQW